MAISMLKIRRPLGRLIFNMGIAIPGKTVFLIETAPRIHALLKTESHLCRRHNDNLQCYTTSDGKACIMTTPGLRRFVISKQTYLFK